MDSCSDTVLVPARVLAAHPDGFCLTMDGESMNNILRNGCRAYIHPRYEVVHDGKPHAVCVNGYDATIKRVRRLESSFELDLVQKGVDMRIGLDIASLTDKRLVL